MCRAGKYLAEGAALLLLCGIGLSLADVAPAQSPQELAGKAAQAMQRKDYAAAESTYRQLIPLAPRMAELHSNLGLACFLQKKVPCAVEAFQAALELKDELFLPNFTLGQIRFQQGRYRDARELAGKALELQPQQPEVRQLFIAALVGLKEYQRAIDEYGVLLKAHPNDVEAHYGLGGVYMEMSQQVADRLKGREDSGYSLLITAEGYAPDPQWLSFASSTFRDAFDKDIRLPGARIAFARLQMSQQVWAAARSTLEAELELDPKSYEARFYLAQVALAQGDAASSVRLLNEAVRIRPEFFKPLPELMVHPSSQETMALRSALDHEPASFGSAFLLSRLKRGRQRGGAGNGPAADAERHRDKILVAFGDEPAGEPSERAGLELLRGKRYEAGLKILLPLAREGNVEQQTHAEIARALVRIERFEDVTKLFRRREPDSPEEIYLLGTSYKQIALATLERMAQLNPDSPRAHQVLGDSYMARQRFENAVEEYERAVELAPKRPELHYLLGRAMYRSKEFGRSADVFARAIELDPLNAEVHAFRGDALAQLGRNEEAIQSLKKSLELNPELTQARLLLGKAYRMAGNDTEALLHLEKGSSADTDGTVHYQLFLLYRKLNKPQEAKAALQKSQQLRVLSREAGN